MPTASDRHPKAPRDPRRIEAIMPARLNLRGTGRWIGSSFGAGPIEKALPCRSAARPAA